MSKAAVVVRCSCCHDSLAISLAARCADCATLAHPDCLSLVTGCPTLGCAGALVAPRRIVNDLAASAANGLAVAVMFVAGVTSVGWLVMTMATGILETFTF